MICDDEQEEEVRWRNNAPRAAVFNAEVMCGGAKTNARTGVKRGGVRVLRVSQSALGRAPFED